MPPIQTELTHKLYICLISTLNLLAAGDGEVRTVFTGLLYYNKEHIHQGNRPHRVMIGWYRPDAKP